MGNFNDFSQEGSIKTINKLRDFFRGKYNISINHFNKRCDLINIHSSGFFETFKYPKLKGKKIYSIHSNMKNNFFRVLFDFAQVYRYFYDYKQDRYSSFDRIIKTIFILTSHLIPLQIKKLFLKKMDLVIITDRSLYKKLKLKNSCIIPHGIDCNKFRNLKLKSKKLRASYFGHPDPSKGLIKVINTFSKLDDIEKHIYLSLPKSKLSGSRIKKYINKKDQSIKVFGLVKDMEKEYNKSDIIILPYRHESSAISTPLVLIEAMACERTIITTRLPHLERICGDSVIYVDPYSTKQIVETINRLSNDKKLRERLGKKARERVVKYYNEEHMLKKYGEIYKKELANIKK